MLALSWAAAFVACLGYGVGSVLQAVGARRTAPASGISGAARILRQLPYLAGLAADGSPSGPTCSRCSGCRCSWSSPC